MDIDAMGYRIRDLLIANQQLTAQVAELQAFRDRFSPMLEEAEAHYLASRSQATEQPQNSEQQQGQAEGQKSDSGEQQDAGEQSNSGADKTETNPAGEAQDGQEGTSAPTAADDTAEANPGEPQATEQP
ncbi:hypothetical protein ACN6KF_001458 [Labrys sp. La1]|uniref:hypothetical protein n=1 Tax=Labrys sp. La1 TaxID=3404917 RepID=UPI003EB9C3BF